MITTATNKQITHFDLRRVLIDAFVQMNFEDDDKHFYTYKRCLVNQDREFGLDT
jgi:hypothetical protein